MSHPIVHHFNPNNKSFTDTLSPVFITLYQQTKYNQERLFRFGYTFAERLFQNEKNNHSQQ